MKRIRDKVVAEDVKLIDCKKGDLIQFRYTPYHVCGINRAVVVKVKTIQGNKLQLKYRSQWRGDTAKIQKIDLPIDIVVERSRNATRADHEDKMLDDAVEFGEARYQIDPRSPQTMVDTWSGASADEMSTHVIKVVDDSQVEILDPLPPVDSQEQHDRFRGRPTTCYGDLGLFSGIPGIRITSHSENPLEGVFKIIFNLDSSKDI